MVTISGIDFANKTPGKKVPCFACYDAEVIEAGWSKYGYGNHVVLKTDRNGAGLTREILYAHLDRIDVKKGDRVYLGDQIGVIGTTGNSTGVHLHLALRNRDKNGRIVNKDNGFRGRFNFDLIYFFKSLE